MHPHRRRKKRHNYGIRSVEVERGPNGFGFTISGQQPCILSCIVCNSPADQAGLRAGDFLISVNGLSVSKSTHDAVVKLIGSSIGPIRMSIAEYYYSDSSDEELDVSRMVSSRKPKYAHKPRTRHHKPELPDAALARDLSPKKNVKLEYKKQERERDRYVNAAVCRGVAPVEENMNDVYDSRVYVENGACSANGLQEQENVNPMAYSALVGYLGTIEMPNALQPSTRLQTVCSCIRKLRQEKRAPTAVLMTVLPACLTLKNSNNQLLAIYPANRVTYISSSTDKESRYFGLVTSAVSENRGDNYGRYAWEQNKQERTPDVDVSNSCHVFVTDPKLLDHKVHVKKAENFNISCTADIITGNCLEFPKNALYVVSLVQNMYRLQNCGHNESRNYNIINEELLIANSPQPSASSNSDSGIGFRDDCGNISDRILVVEFPPNTPRPLHNFPLHLPLQHQNHRPHAIDGSLENLENYNRLKKSPKKEYESPRKDSAGSRNRDSDNFVRPKDVCDDRRKYSRLSTRVTDSSLNVSQNSVEPELSSDDCRTADVDTGQIFCERAVDVPDKYFSTEDTITEDFKSSVDNISVHSFRSCDLSTIRCNKETSRCRKTARKQASCDNLREELDSRCAFGSLQELAGVGWSAARPTVAMSEPDVRTERTTRGSTLDLMNVSSFISLQLIN